MPTTNGLRRVAALSVFGFGLLLALCGLGIMSVSATPASSSHTVTICHATGLTSRPYVQLDMDAVEAGRSSVAGDIIPPFSYGTVRYAGRNWTPQGQTIWLSGCGLTAVTVSPLPSPVAVGQSAGSGAVRAGSAPAAPLAGAGDGGAADVVGILMSTVGFLAMGLGLVAQRRREV